jgi:hypothetical protein
MKNTQQIYPCLMALSFDDAVLLEVGVFLNYEN